MQKIKIILLFAVIISTTVNAQQTREFSLQQAIDYALKNNYDLMKSEKDIEAAKQTVRESTSMGLPQINGSVGYNNNIASPVIIMPAMPPLSTEPTEVQFGTKHDATLTGSLSQLIFSGEYVVGLQAARKYLESTNVEFFKNKTAVVQQVANSYYSVLTTEKGLEIIDTTLKVTRSLANETQQYYEAGFSEDIDVDQLELLVSDLEASRIYFINQLNITHAFLKFYLAVSESDSLILSDNLDNILENMEGSSIMLQQFEVNTNPDFYSLLKQKELSELKVKLEKATYYPSINASLYYQTQAQREEFNFFNSGKWYSSSALGVTMNIPIFSSGQRNSRLKQARIAYEQMEIMEDQLENQLNLQYKNARSEYLNSFKVYENKDRNRKVAEKIYFKTSEKYKQGLASSLDILNTHNQFLNAERDYLAASQAFLQAGEELKKILTKTITN